MTKCENEKLGISVELPELRQRDVEAFFRAVRELQGGDLNVSSPELVGVTVRAAARVGLLPGVNEGAIDDMRPAAVMALSQAVNDHLAEALRVPGE